MFLEVQLSQSSGESRCTANWSRRSKNPSDLQQKAQNPYIQRCPMPLGASSPLGRGYPPVPQLDGTGRSGPTTGSTSASSREGRPISGDPAFLDRGPVHRFGHVLPVDSGRHLRPSPGSAVRCVAQGQSLVKHRRSGLPSWEVGVAERYATAGCISRHGGFLDSSRVEHRRRSIGVDRVRLASASSSAVTRRAVIGRAERRHQLDVTSESIRCEALSDASEIRDDEQLSLRPWS